VGLINQAPTKDKKRGQATFSGRNRLFLLVESPYGKSSLSPFFIRFCFINAYKGMIW
jgi:hypothetical protein